MGESVDIIVQETGTDEATAKFQGLGVAADEAATKLDNTNASIDFLKNAASASTSPLQQMAEAAQNNGNAVSGLDNAVTAAESRLRLYQSIAARTGETVEEVARKVAEASQAFHASADAAHQTSTASEQHAAASDHAAHSTEHLTEVTHLLKEALTALGLALSVEKLVEMAEGYEKIALQLGTVSKNSHDLEETERKLFEISQSTGSSLASNAAAYQKLAIETSGLGISQKELMSVVEGVNTVIRLGGGTATESADALRIFGRALATGEVQGRQFRTLLLQFPQLGQLIAKGLNEPISAMTKFSQTAPLASKDFVKAFNEAAEGSIKAGKAIELTLGSALTTLGNVFLQYVGHLNETGGVTTKLASIVEFLAHNFETLATIVRVGITVWASYFVLLVAIPGVFAAITTSIVTLTAAIAANPFGAMLVAVTALIALVYQFGNSIKLTSDGSITVLGALVGVFNVLRNVLQNVWSFLTTVFGPAFRVVGSIIAFVFEGAVAIVRLFVNALGTVIPALQPLQSALNSLTSPLTTFKQIMVESMTEATTKMNETHGSAQTLAGILGSDDTTSVSGAATKAATSVGDLSNSLTQMGRVNAAAIPPFTNLVDQAERSKKIIADAAEQFKKYSAQVDATAKAVEALALTTRNAMGDMVTSTDEWARRSGADFNSVKSQANDLKNTLEQVAQAAADAANASVHSSSSPSGGSSGGSTGALHSFSSGLAGGGDGPNVQGHKTKWNASGSELLIDWKDNGNFTKDTRPWTNSVSISGFATGGAFDVGGSGGTDSQLVQFMASPNERVTIETPSQRKDRLDGQGTPSRSVVVNMTVHTPDANSFRRSKNQTLLELKSKLNGVGR